MTSSKSLTEEVWFHFQNTNLEPLVLLKAHRGLGPDLVTSEINGSLSFGFSGPDSEYAKMRSDIISTVVVWLSAKIDEQIKNALQPSEGRGKGTRL